MKIAKGEYIAYLDDDDRYYPSHIRILVEYLNNHPEKIAVYSLVYAIYQVKYQGKLSVAKANVEWNMDFDRDRILVHNYIANMGIMHRRSILEQIGYFDESLPTLEDWEFFIRLALAGDIGNINKITMEGYRIIGNNHRNQLTEDSIKVYQLIYDRYSKYETPNIKQARNTVLKQIKENLDKIRVVQSGI